MHHKYEKMLAEAASSKTWSGGFQPLSLLPHRLVAAAEAVDRVVSRLPALTATRCLLVVERS